MAIKYDTETCSRLTEKVQAAGLARPARITRYEPGTELTYTMRAVTSAQETRVTVRIERFVGGGFAGQVYRVQVTALDQEMPGLAVGGVYAVKILIPPSNFSLKFRDALYWVGFQGPFQLQVNPAAARAGALWQTFIRRAAQIRFGVDNSVVAMHATFVDETLGSCGEISEWIEGRTWQLEVDERMDLLRRWSRGRTVEATQLGSPEFRAKKKFMTDFVTLLHEVGAHEFARQYEWSTCKSQPNCLKRSGDDNDPGAGLTAVDFRAGLALLPFLPMSPGDFKLIAKGIGRGSWVQFDRGNLETLQAFVDKHAESFADLRPLLPELRECEATYRASLPDVTHNGTALLRPSLWRSIMGATVTGWHVRNRIDDAHHGQFNRSRILFFLFASLSIVGGLARITAAAGFLGLLIGGARVGFDDTPFNGNMTACLAALLVGGTVAGRLVIALRLCWGREDWRRHFGALWRWDYFRRALRARMCEQVIGWLRGGRVSAAQAESVADSLPRFALHRLAALLPVAGLHRFILDPAYAKDRLHYLFIRPFQLYFDADLREQWMRDMVEEGQRKHILSDEDAQTILGQLQEPYIQKYLVSLVVHIMTLPVTQIVSILVAWIFYITHPDMEPGARAAAVAGILVLFQVVPLSPGSLCRGLYVVYMVIKDRDFRNYNIAVFLGFFKYVGYLAFPIQMTYRYPAMARFMAGHWATEAVHVVPVFGEGGALLEHAVFGWFYNWPLTLRRRMCLRAELRAQQPSRWWHVPVWVVLGAAAFGLTQWIVASRTGQWPSLRDSWAATLVIPLACGAFITLGARGASFGRRIVGAAVGGVLLGSVAAGLGMGVANSLSLGIPSPVATWIWHAFTATVFATVGALVTELLLPEPNPDKI